MAKIIISLSLIATLLISCKSSKEIQKPCVKIKESEQAQMSYYLPKNAYHIEVKVLRKQLFRGPYAIFAEEYLGVNKNIAGYDETSFSILSTNIEVIAEPDAVEQYFVYLDKNRIVPINITNNGILAGMNLDAVHNETTTRKNHNIPVKKEFVFLDLSSKPIVDIRDEVTYEYKKVDSALVRVPIENTVTEVKNFQQLAWSAAKFIANLRESRFRLLSGLSEMDHIPEKIEVRVNKIDKLEQNYLELFVGHAEYDTLTYHFYVHPERNGSKEFEEPLFLFSSRLGVRINPKGIEEAELYTKGTPVVFKISSCVFPKPKSKAAIEVIKSKGLVYRIPARANATVQIKNEIIANKLVPISQWGSLSFLPAELLVDKNLVVQFDIQTGQLLKVKLK